jgi:hypothetical protein
MLDRVTRLAAFHGRRRDLGPADVNAEEARHRAHSGTNRPVDRRLANKNIRTALIAGAISLVIFALSFFSGFIYT